MTKSRGGFAPFWNGWVLVFSAGLCLVGCASKGGFDSATATGGGSDALPMVTVNSASASKGSPVVFYAVLNRASSSNVSVAWNTVNGTAISGQHYYASSGKLSFPSGTTSLQFSVPTYASNGVQVDPSLTFNVSLSSSAQAVMNQSSILGSITDPLSAGVQALAYNNEVIYADAYDYGWSAHPNSNMSVAVSTSLFHSGLNSLKVTCTTPSTTSNGVGICSGKAMGFLSAQKLALPFDTISFWIYPTATTPAESGFYVASTASNGTAYTKYNLPNTPPVGVWTQVIVPLTDLGLTSTSNFTVFYIGANVPQNYSFYLDDVQLIAGAHVPNKTAVQVSLNPSFVPSVSSMLRGVNTITYDTILKSSKASELALFEQAGIHTMRFHGSHGDQFDWSKNQMLRNATADGTNMGTMVALTSVDISAADFATYIESMQGQGYITVNYGNGTAQQAAAWVAWANGSPTNAHSIGVDIRGVNWQTVAYWAGLRAVAPLATDDGYNFLRISHPNPFGIQHWDVGNEIYGTTWEIDLHGISGSGLPGVAHDPVTYAKNAAQYYQLMKAVDPTIKIGLITAPFNTSPDDAYPSATMVTDATDGTVHSGWNAVVLKTFAQNAGVPPDYLIYHHYPFTGGLPGISTESDYGALMENQSFQYMIVNLRRMAVDYAGAPSAAKVEIDVTEMNTAGSSVGKLSTNLTGALWAADSIATATANGVTGMLFWCIHDELINEGINLSSTLYGPRNYGSYGLLYSGVAATGYYAGTGWSGTPPSIAMDAPVTMYYMYRLLNHWAQSGDSVEPTVTDNGFVTAYGSRKADGTLSVLLINKHPTSNIQAMINVAGTTHAYSSATLYLYDKDNDLRQTDVGVTDLDVESAMTLSLPPYSASVLVFAP